MHSTSNHSIMFPDSLQKNKSNTLLSNSRSEASIGADTFQYRYAGRQQPSLCYTPENCSDIYIKKTKKKQEESQHWAQSTLVN